MSIGETRSALRDALKATGLRSSDTWPDMVNLPAAIVWGPIARTLDTFNGGVTRDWEVHLLIASAEQDRSIGQRKLDPYLDEDGPGSVIQAIEDGGPFTVTSWADYGARATGEEASAYFGATLNLTELVG